MSEKKLTVWITNYGVSEIPVVTLDYNNFGELPTFEIKDKQIPLEVLEKMAEASKRGFEIEVKREGLNDDPKGKGG